MVKSISVSKSTQDGTKLDDLVREGKALGKMWSTLHSVKQSTKANGFDTRLGKLLIELKAQSSVDSGQVSRQTLTTYGVHNIDRRRRSEALWFAENEVDCREFINNSKKGYTSLTALQKAMKDATAKADATEVEATDEDTAKAEVSNVGQSNKPSKDDIVKSIVKACEYSGIDLLDIAEALMQIDTVSEADEVETKVAA